MNNGLRKLMECHFHEDWQADYETTAAAIAHFVELEPITVVRDAQHRIDLLMEEAKSDDEVERELGELGCAVSTAALGLTARSWLSAIRTELLKYTSL